MSRLGKGIFARMNIFRSAHHEDLSQPSLAVSFEEKVRPLIDLIDELRRFGLDEDVNLPSVVVIGDQSSGKSSILEAISGVQLPRGRGIVTRCPLEMQLKKVSGDGDSWTAELKYTTLNRQQREFRVTDPSELEELIRAAQTEITGTNRSISDSMITLKVEGTSCPDLTLIDLPGIARTAVDDQPADICQQIRRLLHRFTSRRNTIMLCVIPSNVDIAVNEALTIAKKADPNGSRTLGVLTKPDLIDEGGETEILAVLQNRRFRLKKGYSVVRCRGQKNIDDQMSLEAAITQEEEFFTSHPIFSSVEHEMRGTRNLAKKLTENLVEHIERSLPQLLKEIERTYEDTSKELHQMRSGPLDTDPERRNYLSRTVEPFLKDMEEAVVHGNFVPTGVLLNGHSEETSPEECRASFQWRSRFRKLASEIDRLTKSALGPDGELDHSTFSLKLETYRGEELPRFINFELFRKLICQHVAKYEGPAVDCLHNMNCDVQSLSEFVCDKHYRHIPQIKSRFRQVCADARQQCKVHGSELIKFEVRKEKLVYTQDGTFESQLAVAEEKAALDDTRPEAKELHRLLSTYLEVANRRINDSVPMIIRVTQHEDFMDLLRERVFEAVGEQDIVKLVREEPSVAQRRKLLTDRQNRLRAAIQKLNRL